MARACFWNLRDPPADRHHTRNGRGPHTDFAPARSADGRLHMKPRATRGSGPAVGVALDVLTAVESASPMLASRLLGVSTGNLIDFLQTDPKVWQEANRLRTVFGHKTLR